MEIPEYLLKRAQAARDKVKNALKTNGNMDFNVKLKSANPPAEDIKAFDLIFEENYLEDKMLEYLHTLPLPMLRDDIIARAGADETMVTIFGQNIEHSVKLMKLTLGNLYDKYLISMDADGIKLIEQDKPQATTSTLMPIWKHVFIDGIHFHNKHDQIAYGTITKTSLCSDEFAVGNTVYFYGFHAIEIPTENGFVYMLETDSVMAYKPKE